MKVSIVVLALIALANDSFSQEKPSSSFLDLTIAAGSYRGSLSFSYMHTWKLGVKKKLGIGTGVRMTSFLGANQYYITAPATITSESTSPLIFFKENIVKNIDSLLVKSPQVNAINILINIDYDLSPKWKLGFNIDAIGFSFGTKQRGNYINGAEGKNTDGNPTPFNFLLVSDNDRGSLNSELYARYFLTDQWAIKFGPQFLFTEYTTKTKVQVLPSENDRFRNKSLLFSVGVSYKLK
jgi:hypothetical protein